MAMPMEMDPFTSAYIQAALWSSNDESTESGGEPFDANYSMLDIAPESLDGMRRDAKRFQRENGELLRQAYASGHYEASTAGFDFWLTRNGHGAGFWDRDLPDDLGEKLTAASKAYGEQDLYLGDDGKIYASGAERWVNAPTGRSPASEDGAAPSGVAQDFPSPEDAMHHAAHTGYTHFTQVGAHITVYGPGPDGKTVRAKLYYKKGKYHLTSPGLTKKPIPVRAHVIEHEHHHDDHDEPHHNGSHPVEHSHASAPVRGVVPENVAEWYYIVKDGRIVEGPYQDWNYAVDRARGYGGTVIHGVPAQYEREGRSTKEGPYAIPKPDHRVITSGSHRGVTYKVYEDYDEPGKYSLVIDGGAHNGGQGWHQDGFASPEHAEASAKASIDAYPREYGADAGGHEAGEPLREKGLVWLHRPDGIYWANSRGGTYWLTPTPDGLYAVTWMGMSGEREDLGSHSLASAYQVAARFDPEEGQVRSRQVAAGRGKDDPNVSWSIPLHPDAGRWVKAQLRGTWLSAYYQAPAEGGGYWVQFDADGPYRKVPEIRERGDQPAPVEGKLTLARAKEILKAVGMTLSKKVGEYRVNFVGGSEESAYYTDDLEDAVVTGSVMALKKYGQRPPDVLTHTRTEPYSAPEPSPYALPPMRKPERDYGPNEMEVSERTTLTHHEAEALKTIFAIGGSQPIPVTMGRMTPERRDARTLRKLTVNALIDRGLVEWQDHHGKLYRTRVGPVSQVTLLGTAAGARALHDYEMRTSTVQSVSAP